MRFRGREINFTDGGGSSNVFKSALKASFGNLMNFVDDIDFKSAFAG